MVVSGKSEQCERVSFMVARATSKITLPANFGAPAATPQEVEPVHEVSVVQNLTDVERQQAASAVKGLHEQYFVGMNKLARAVGRSTDLKTILLKQRNVPYDFVVQIAAAVGLTVDELFWLPALSSERAEQLRRDIHERELLESRRPRLVNPRLEIFTARRYSR